MDNPIGIAALGPLDAIHRSAPPGSSSTPRASSSPCSRSSPATAAPTRRPRADPVGGGGGRRAPRARPVHPRRRLAVVAVVRVDDAAPAGHRRRPAALPAVRHRPDRRPHDRLRHRHRDPGRGVRRREPRARGAVRRCDALQHARGRGIDAARRRALPADPATGAGARSTGGSTARTSTRNASSRTFAQQTRDEVDLERLQDAVVDTIDRSVAPSATGLWLRPAGGTRT